MPPQITDRRSYVQIARVVEPDRLGSLKRDGDNTRVGLRCDEEIVFEPALGAVIGDIDARICLLIDDTAVHGDARAPFQSVITDEVIGPARQPLLANDRTAMLTTNEAHATPRLGRRAVGRAHTER